MPAPKKKYRIPAVASPQTQLEINPRYLNLRQAAVYCSVSIWAIRALIAEKKIKFAKVGKGFTVDRLELDAYWQDQANRTAA